MSTKNKTFSVIFFTKKDKLKSSKFPVYMRITVDGVRRELSLKYRIKEEQWNGGKGMGCRLSAYFFTKLCVPSRFNFSVSNLSFCMDK